MTQVRIPSWLARIILVLLAIVVVGIGLVSIVLLPVILGVLLVVHVVATIVRGGGNTAAEADRRCTACGASLRGLGSRGVCPSCNTVFGIDLEVRHETVADSPAEPPLLLPPPDRARPGEDPRR